MSDEQPGASDDAPPDSHEEHSVSEAAAANCGAVYQQDEYAHPSKNANGGHLHFQLRPGLNGAAGPYYPQSST